MLTVLTIKEALDKMLANLNLNQGGQQVLSLVEAVGRVLANDAIAQKPIPEFRRSTVDGYAVRAVDCQGASESSSILLPCAFEVQMGQGAPRPLEIGECAYVPTGGHIPDGADAMVMVEWTQEMGLDRLIERTVAPGDHVVQIGEDVVQGQLVLPAGTLIGAHHVGALAAMGIARIQVKSKLTAAIFSSGDELQVPNETLTLIGDELLAPSETLAPSDGTVQYGVFDANTSIVHAQLAELGVDVVHTGHLKDDEAIYNAALKAWAGKVDLVILSGGSSAGVRDFTEKAILGLPGAELLVHGLAIQPGKPTIVGKSGSSTIIGLPGHPSACFMTMNALVKPFVHQWLTGQPQPLRTVPCEVTFRLHGSSGRQVYQLVTLEDTPAGKRAHLIYGKSGMVSTMAKANAYIVLPMMHEGLLPGDMATAVYL